MLGSCAALLLTTVSRAANGTAVFNEVMYQPAAGAAEWVELKNLLSVNLELSGWQLSGGVSFTFPEGTVLPAGGFLLVSSTAGAPTGALGPWTGALANDGETLRLRNRNGAVVDEFGYDDSGDWPVGADGSGATLSKRRADSDSARAESWLASSPRGGTPGAENFPGGPPAPGVVLNELAPAGAGFFVELRNFGVVAAELGGLVLAGSEGAGEYVLPANSLGPGEVWLIDAATLGFTPGADAKLFLFAPNRTALLDAQRLRTGARARTVDGSAWLRPAPLTPGAPNAFALRDELVISETNYHPRVQPARAGVYADSTFVNVVDSWKFEAGGADLQTAWREPGYDDSAWATGTAPFEAPAGRTYADAVQAAAPVAYWRLGETPATGIAADASAVGGAQNGTYTNATARAGLIRNDANGAVQFSGTAHVAGAGVASVFANDWTIEAWFTHDAAEQFSGIFSNNGLSGEKLGPLLTFIDVTNRVGISAVGGNQDHISVDLGPTHLGKPVYAVITKTGGNAAGSNTVTVRAWVDGVPVTPTTGATSWNLTPHDSWLIGRHWAGAGYHRGAIDEVAIYNRAISAGEAEEHARRGSGLASTGLPDTPATKYFRKSFNFSGDPAKTALTIDTLLDDGAVIHLNGVELTRQNMPEGPVTHATPAATAVTAAQSSGPVLLPPTGLRAGVNVLAVELHQAAGGVTDAVFAIKLTARETISPPRLRAELETEFVELHNRSAGTVDLAGWSLSGDIDYVFPAGGALASGGFLAVARDPAVLAARHPGGAIVGPFAGRLSNSGGRVVLRDPAGNPAAAVAFADGAPWPDAADGGGSSLERLDPRADSTAPATWAASDESARTAWQSYSYRGVAAPSVLGPDAQWKEFIVGLLDNGEVLLDDVHVIENPDGARTEMLQNSDFSSGLASWRIIGNHVGTVIPDPSSPGNNVLRLVTTGAVGNESDHMETTFAGGRSITNGLTYEISFRARPVSGNAQLNTRLYFNRLPRTTVLPTAEASGTPGAPNSRPFRNLGPTLTELRHSPAVPAAGTAVPVRVRAADPDGLGAATLRYSANGGGWQSVPMANSGGVLTANIPAQGSSSIVQFYVEAADALGAIATAPARGPNSRALFKVQDNLANLATLHNVRIVMTAADATFMHTNANTMSNGDLGATVIVDESEIFYDCGVHLRGSTYGRPFPSLVSFTVRFPATQLFRGVLPRIALDRSGRSAFGDTSPDEIIVKHMSARGARGLADQNDDIVRVITPLPQHTSVALLGTGFSDEWLDSHFENGSESPLYDYELIYYLTRTPDGNPQSPKFVEPTSLVQTDIRDLGPNGEDYRWNFLPENVRDANDFSRLRVLGAALERTGVEVDAAARAILDVDQWFRTFALNSLIGNGDTYMQGYPHNMKLYVRPEDGRFLAYQHDADVWIRQATNAPLYGATFQNFVKVIALPPNLRLYHGHLLDLINTTFNPSYMGPWITHYGAKAGINFGAALTYITDRRAYVLSQLPGTVPFAISTNGGQPFTVNASSAALAGTGWIDIREFRRRETGAVLPVTWTSSSAWRVNIALNPGENIVGIEARGFNGELLGTREITITSTVVAPLARDFLRITELQYHPADPAGAELNVSTDAEDFEFLELRNLGTEPLEIGGCYFDAGIAFTFPSPTLLAAGESIVVARALAAFQARYGGAVRVAGSYAPSALSNDGETLRLRDATGAIIQSFAWDDAWFPASDGGGYSLIVREPGAPLEAWNTAAQWAINAAPGGTPGSSSGSAAWQFAGWRYTFFTPAQLADPLVSGPLGSAAGDGIANQLRYALGWNPTEPTSALLTASLDGGQLAATYRRRKNLLDVQFVPEVSRDARSWGELLNFSTAIVDEGDGTETVTLRDLTPPVPQEPRFVRLRVTLR